MGDEKSVSSTTKTMKQDSRLNAEINNPCLKEHVLSLKCLDEKNYDHLACAKHFENYKTCKQFWNIIANYRKRDGIHPLLPEPKDRERIKEDYIANKHVRNYQPIYR